MQTEKGCWVHLKWGEWTAYLNLYDSKVRTRNGKWVPLLPRTMGVGLQKYVDVIPDSESEYNKFFSANVELRQKCDAPRRYKFKIVGKEENPRGKPSAMSGVERWLYYPPETVEVPGTGRTYRQRYTTKTTLDLGWLDTCLWVPDKCGER